MVDIILFLFRPLFGPRIDTDLPQNTPLVIPLLYSLFGDIYIFTERVEDPATITTPSTKVGQETDTPKYDNEIRRSVSAIHPEEEEERVTNFRWLES